MSFNYIRLGHADVMVTGGSEAATIAGMGGFNAMHAYQKMTDQQQLLDQWTKTEMALF
jgi:3-oxoacyl-[acyl-carrier-protein] synthase II